MSDEEGSRRKVPGLLDDALAHHRRGDLCAAADTSRRMNVTLLFGERGTDVRLRYV